jgi:hypothetical protein
MSIALVEQEIRRLLATRDADVVCISGHWGVGKTYAWNKYLKEAKGRPGGIALGHYSYVSLFGITSLDELKHAIFENSVSAKHIGARPSLATLGANVKTILGQLRDREHTEIKPSVKSFGSNVMARVNQAWRKGTSFLQFVPMAKVSAGAVGPLGYLSIKENIICIDDIERRGDKLAVRDVLGLVSNLKESKRCKVFIILNDDAMDKEKEEFATHSEKVVDIHLKFAPTARESVQIALTTDTENIRLLGEHCITLGISNIRVIKRLERAVLSLEPLLNDFDKAIMQLAVHSVVLLGWSHLEPKSAPPLDFLKKRVPNFLSDYGKKPPSEQEAAWNALLDAYDFGVIDDFGLALLKGIRDGYFDAEPLRRMAGELNRQLKDANTYAAYRQAWNLYHESFGDDADDLSKQMVSSFVENVQRINIGDMHGTVQLLKALGKTEQAQDVIDAYVSQHGTDKAAFDRQSLPFGEMITDPDLIKALDNKLRTFADERDPVKVLLSISQGWSPEDLSLLQEMSVDQFYNMFKHNSGNTLRQLIDNCLQFNRIGNAPDAGREIARRARAALEKIGMESPLNAMRVRKYGIVISRGESSPEATS